MEKFDVKGMTCAACSARVEKAVKEVEGVNSVEVNLLLNSMKVDYSSPASQDIICKAVEKAGYQALPEKRTESQKPTDKIVSENKTKLKELIASVVLMLPLMYISMFHTMWHFPLPRGLDNPRVIALLQFILSLTIILINKGFFIRGIRSTIHLAPNMDALVALGSGTAFIYSLVMLFIIVAENDLNAAMGRLHSLYFETSAMILTLISVGKYLEAISKGKTTNAINALLELAPKEAVIVTDDGYRTIDAQDLKFGDIFLVRPACSIPADGVIVEGSSAVDESALTGESMPIDKTVGDKVNAATINLNGAIKCKAVKVGQETNFSKIIERVKEASSGKAPIARLADKVAGVFVPVVLGIAIVTFVVWMIIRKDVEFALSRAISVMVISCPCALGLATPVAIMVGGGRGAKSGILYKTAETMENASKVSIVAFDKTGTITLGKPTVSEVVTADGVNEEEFLNLAVSLESLSEHPLSKAICELKQGNKHVDDFKALTGFGVVGYIDGKKIIGGNQALMQKENVDVSPLINAEELSAKGKTCLFFAYDSLLLGLIAVSDKVKEDAKEAVLSLKKAGITTVMLTGDNERVAENVAKEVGVDRFVAELLPEDKSKAIERLQKYGKVAMVGDGINDAPSLTVADVGIAIGRGTDVAIESADIVLTSTSLKDVVRSLNLSKNVLRIIKQNLFWAFIYNSIGIPLAAGVFVGVGVMLNPMFGALAMSLSSFCVVMNALRLNVINQDKIKIKGKEIIIDENDLLSLSEKFAKEYDMKKVIKIEGMMCEHCKARVEKALAETEGVEKVDVDLKKGTATVKSNDLPKDEVLTKAVTDQGYKVVEIK